MGLKHGLWLVLLVLVLAGCQATFSTGGPEAGATVAVPGVAGSATQGGMVAEPAADAACGPPNSDIPGACFTESLLAAIVQYLTFFAELCGALVIAVAVLRGLLRYLPHVFVRQSPDETYQESIRLQLGKSLALALEFELAADILKTAVAPSLAIIAQLAAIIVLRTLLNYFLERELRQVEQRRAGEHLRGGPTPAAGPEPAAGVSQSGTG